MKNKYLSLGLLAIGMFFAQSTFAQTQTEKQKIIQTYDQEKLSAIEVSFKNKAQAEKEEAYRIAAQRGWKTKLTTSDGRYMELQKVVNGKPIYYTTFNIAAAKSTRTDHIKAGGSLGLNLLGQNMTAHVWDGGTANVNHQEYDGAGGNNRFSSADGSGLNFHAEHVTGTIIASGFVAEAEGMAPQASAVGYDWNSDQSEVTSEAANGMIISNHSYGFATRDDNGNVLIPARWFGTYISESRAWDEILFNAPNYLMVVAAGNDGSDNTANSNPNFGAAWDKLTGHATSKNTLVVANAQDANIDANGNLISVTINSGSSEGPTDDLRIKPDIAGNGTQVYSSFNFASYDATYGTNYADGNIRDDYAGISGTSMASPNVTGSLLLLQQHNNNVHGSFMTAATLKGLALHTADDAGASGPDAVFGWGLLNAKVAAEVISGKNTTSEIQELSLSSGQSYSITVDSDGINPLLASISWTDRAGTSINSTNSSTTVLVNDLDVRVTQGGTTYLPYELTGPNTHALQDNNRDPYERIDVANASGTYTITVTHKGSLVGGSQNFSLIVTGLTGTPAVCNATTPTGVTVSGITTSGADINWDSVTGATYTVRYRETGTSGWTTSAAASNSTTLTGLAAGTSYQVQVRSVCSSGNSSYSSSVTFTTSSVPTFCSGGISSFPYSEGFESSVGWTQVGGDDGDWVRTNVRTPSNNTGPTSAVQGSYYLFLEASSNNSPGKIGANATAILESDCFDLSGETSATLSFQNHMYGNNVGSLTVQASTDGTSWTNIWSDSGNNGNQWNDVSINLNSYVGQQFKLRIVGTTGNGWSSDIAVDNIALTAGNPLTYCDSSGSRTTYEWIDYVALGGMTNPSGASSGYADYTNLTATVAIGSSNTITVSAGFSGNSYTEFWNVWIDFNQDGTFDSSENVTTGSSSSANNLTATFTVPSNASLGNTRMRVSMKFDANATPCENFGDGEVEDYTVNITNNTTSSANYATFSGPSSADQLQNEGNIFDFTIYPNPVREGILTVKIVDGRETSYTIKNMLGQTIKANELTNNRISVDDLNSGMYIIEVSDGQKSITKKFIKQ